MRNYYLQKASDPAQILDGSQPLSGTVGPPPDPDLHIYYSSAALHLGQPGAPLTVNGVYVIYVASDVFIDNDVVLNPNSWIGVLSEQTIHISAAAPDAVQVYGTYVANGNITADGSARAPSSTLSLHGSFVGQALSFSYVYIGARTYAYQTTSDPNLLLPNVTTQLEYQITQGKYN
jgi:hypothetical protein